MKFLVTGFLIFACWASLSTWIYVCKIKGLCGERENITVSTSAVSDRATTDSLAKTPEAVTEAPDVHLVHFDFDKSSFLIDSEMSAFIDTSLIYVTQHSEAGLFITGHTDNIGTVEYNMALGYRRAQSIKDYFTNKGVPADNITIVSKGENEPIETNSTANGRARNRRATISVTTNK